METTSATFGTALKSLRPEHLRSGPMRRGFHEGGDEFRVFILSKAEVCPEPGSLLSGTATVSVKNSVWLQGGENSGSGYSTYVSNEGLTFFSCNKKPGEEAVSINSVVHRFQH